jgi:uncharacterized membrane protein YgcG
LAVAHCTAAIQHTAQNSTEQNRTEQNRTEQRLVCCAGALCRSRNVYAVRAACACRSWWVARSAGRWTVTVVSSCRRWLACRWIRLSQPVSTWWKMASRYTPLSHTAATEPRSQPFLRLAAAQLCVLACSGSGSGSGSQHFHPSAPLLASSSP